MTTPPEHIVEGVYDHLCRINGEWQPIGPNDIKEVITAALPFLPVQGAVKKLEWRKGVEFGAITAHGAGVDYTIWSDFSLSISPISPREYHLARIVKAEDQEAAKAEAQADYEARIRSALETSVCKTCNGRGIIGGMYRVGDGDVDGWEEPCPDCSPSAGRAAALEEAATLLEREACELDGLVDSVAHHLRSKAKAIRALYPASKDLPQDVINLVIAAREACDSWQLADCEFNQLKHVAVNRIRDSRLA